MENEIIKFRTSHSKSFRKNDKIVQESYSYPIHYKNEGNEWEEIDISIQKCKEWEFTNAVTSSMFNIYFGDSKDNINNHLFGVEYKDGLSNKWINFKLINAKLSTYETYGDNNEKFKFVNAIDNIDVEYIVCPDSLKENIIIKEKNNIRKFDFSIKSYGLKLIQNENKIKIIDLENNNCIWSINEPYMIDDENNISYGIKYQYSDKILSVIIEDEEFINNAKYPIIVDPTVIIDNGTQDVVLRTIGESRPASWTYNSDPSMGVKSFNYSVALSALYFNQLDRFKQSDVILNKAILSIYNYSPGNNFAISNVASPIVSNTDPVSSNDLYFIGGNILINKWINVDFTNQINSLKSNFYGFFMSPTTKENNEGVLFRSPFYSDATLRPKLTLEYLLRPTLGFHSGSPEVNGYYSDNQGNNFKYAEFGTLVAGQTSPSQRIYVRNLADFQVKDMVISVDSLQWSEGMYVELSLSNSPFIATTRLTINGTIEPNQDTSFYIRVRSEDSTQTGANFNIYAKANPIF